MFTDKGMKRRWVKTGGYPQRTMFSIQSALRDLKARGKGNGAERTKTIGGNAGIVLSVKSMTRGETGNGTDVNMTDVIDLRLEIRDYSRSDVRA